MHAEINIRLNAANRCLYALRTLFKSKLLSRKTKEHLYISYIGPVLTYACATWAMTKDDDENLVYPREKFLEKCHVWRTDGSVLKGALTYMIRGKRPRERPRKIWKDSVKELLEEIGGDWEQAYNRERWKELVLAAKSQNGS
ncbi:Uncharacterized protein FWK35_00011454 [Aphis craccivora]|uniref:Reverse transcriptase domain-containing protein n=1 Tax=Aphis craccivora TaxID=307492 RepID=A0A6G0ZKV8_APHCR|nr:Uncharacterized protein FWK35_00011454 [Aphis craccivora]